MLFYIIIKSYFLSNAKISFVLFNNLELILYTFCVTTNNFNSSDLFALRQSNAILHLFVLHH